MRANIMEHRLHSLLSSVWPSTELIWLFHMNLLLCAVSLTLISCSSIPHILWHLLSTLSSPCSLSLHSSGCLSLTAAWSAINVASHIPTSLSQPLSRFNFLSLWPLLFLYPIKVLLLPISKCNCAHTSTWTTYAFITIRPDWLMFPDRSCVWLVVTQLVAPWMRPSPAAVCCRFSSSRDEWEEK